jgi:hypothetical protein
VEDSREERKNIYIYIYIYLKFQGVKLKLGLEIIGSPSRVLYPVTMGVNLAHESHTRDHTLEG